jgi:putative transposase
MNPVRAGLSDEPSEFRWSSFRCNALGDLDELITPHRLYSALAARPATRQLAYRGMFDEILHADVIDEIRRSTRAGRSIGDPMHHSIVAGSRDV